MSNFPTLKFRALDNNGTVLPGATLDFFEWTDGPTTTRQGTWSDLARTVPSANPVVANGDGYFPEVYLDPSLAYYIVFKDADGVLIDDYDEIYAVSLGAADLTIRIRAAGVSPTDYGAIGDGASDESAEVQDAIDAAALSGSIVNLLGLTYRCDHPLPIPSNITIDGGGDGTLDFSNCDDDWCILAAGTFGESIAISVDIAVGDSVISASPSGLLSGDMLFLASSTGWRGGTSGSGELAVMNGAGGEGGVAIAAPARDSYTAVSSALKKVTPVERVTLRGVTVIGSTDASGASVLFSADRCRDIVLEDCKFTGIKTSAVKLQTCLGVDISRCVFEDGDTGSIGVKVYECCESVHIDAGCTFERVETDVDVGAAGTRNGVCRDITVSDSRFVGCTATAIIARMLTEHLLLSGNDIDADSVSAITLTSVAEVKLLGNKVRANGARVLHATGVIDGVLMSGNLFKRVDQAGPCTEFAGTASNNISGVVADGNRFVGGTYGITGSNVESGTFARGPNLFDGQATGETTGLGTNVSLEVNNLTIVGSLTSADIVTTPTANLVPRAGSGGKIDAGWLPDVSGTYAPAAKGVTNGDSHDHSGGDGGQIAHTALSAIGTNSHSTIDSHLSSTSNPHGVTATQVGLSNVTNDAQVKRTEMGAASGVATINGASLVVQNPNSASVSGGANSIAMANASGRHTLSSLACNKLITAPRITTPGTTEEGEFIFFVEAGGYVNIGFRYGANLYSIRLPDVNAQ